MRVLAGANHFDEFFIYGSLKLTSVGRMVKVAARSMRRVVGSIPGHGRKFFLHDLVV